MQRRNIQPPPPPQHSTESGIEAQRKAAWIVRNGSKGVMWRKESKNKVMLRKRSNEVMPSRAGLVRKGSSNNKGMSRNGFKAHLGHLECLPHKIFSCPARTTQRHVHTRTALLQLFGETEENETSSCSHVCPVPPTRFRFIFSSRSAKNARVQSADVCPIF